MNETKSDATRPDRANERVFLTSGGLVDLASRLASPHLVLPWVYGVIGGPLFLLGILLPSVRIGHILSQMVVVPTLRAMSIRKWLNVVASSAIGGLLALLCYSILELPVYAATAVFFVVVLGFGMCNGIVQLISQEVMAKSFDHSRIARLVAIQSSLGGALTIAVALAWILIDPYPQSATRHLVIIASAALIWVAAAFSFALFKERPSRIQPKPSLWLEIRNGVMLYKRSRWFRRYTVMRILFLSVGQAMPFYSIHAASLYAGATHSLTLFIISVGLTDLLSGFIWGKLLSRSPKLVLVCSGLVGAAAGGVALAHGILPRIEIPYLYAAVFALVQLATQGLIQSSNTYVALIAPSEDRPLYLAANNTFLGLVAIGVSGVLGVVAHLSHIVWALWILIALSLIASVSALFLIAPPRD